MPDLFLFAKLVHLLAVILMVGATVINGLLHGQAKKSTPGAASALLRAVLLINRLIMWPSLLLIPLSGGALMALAGYGLSEIWLQISILLSFFLILAYLVGLRLERRLHNIAHHSDMSGNKMLPADYASTFLKAAPIGFGALLMSLIALGLMVFKPF